MENKELIEVEDGMLFEMGTGMQAYCSFVPKTDEEKKQLFNSINMPQKRLKDCINMSINLKHVYAEHAKFIKQDTGEEIKGVRMVLIDDKGEAYQSCAKGVFGALSKMFALIGQPDTWKKPVTVTPKLVSVATDKNVVTLVMN